MLCAAVVVAGNVAVTGRIRPARSGSDGDGRAMDFVRLVGVFQSPRWPLGMTRVVVVGRAGERVADLCARRGKNSCVGFQICIFVSMRGEC